MSDPRERDQRLAEALRANLRRRKAQARAQEEAGTAADNAPGDQASGAV